MGPVARSGKFWQQPLGTWLTSPRVARARHVGAEGMMVWFIVASVVASQWGGTRFVTSQCIVPVWGFVLLMWPEARIELAVLWRSWLIKLLVAVLAMGSVTWLVFQGYSVFEPRWRFMLGVGLLFPAAVGWFRSAGQKGMQFAFLVKAVVLMYAAWRFGLTLFGGSAPPVPGRRWPIYRHIRHFNYDLALVGGLLGGVFSHQKWMSRLLILLGFLLLGFFSFWSGGRGQMVAMCVMLVALIASHRQHEDARFAAMAVMAFLLGGVLVLCSGETQNLFHAVARTDKASLNAVSSGRLRIWVTTLSQTLSTPWGAVFGYGPESFVRMGMYAKLRDPIVHPHNTIVQWVCEYGLLGTAVLVAAAVNLGWRVVWPALWSEKGILRLSAATLVGMAAFAMVDGVFYHASPLLFITLIWAFLYSQIQPAAGMLRKV